MKQKNARLLLAVFSAVGIIFNIIGFIFLPDYIKTSPFQGAELTNTSFFLVFSTLLFVFSLGAGLYLKERTLKYGIFSAVLALLNGVVICLNF